MPEQETVWNPQTELGRKVAQGETTSIESALKQERPIMEPEIVDQLVDLSEEVILIGGTPGKGGGKRRTVTKRTCRMHKSGGRYSSKSMVALGNYRNIVGIGEGTAGGTRAAIEAATREAKLNLMEVEKGNGSWEDTGEDNSSIPFQVSGKAGGVEVELKPAPRGTGLAAGDGVSKLLELAGIENIWVQSRGQTRTRGNQVKAAFNALKKIDEMKR
ncbi:30S ribosomal protein S5 [Nanohaloarchaea archaeon]|nr:30S ribosomal protein S5 [Candidatus Nanohaloarchaea archaeon]